MITLSDLYRQIRHDLWSAGIETADLDARLILRQRTLLDYVDLIARPETLLSQEQFSAVQQDVERRLAREPLSRIFGWREFWGLRFEVSPDTLDPRPDTETLVDAALNWRAARNDTLFRDRSPRVLDMGLGTGCILISLLQEWTDSYGIGIDLSLNALRVAARNAALNGVSDRCSLVCGSWAQSLSGQWDVIVSNPPYIPKGTIGTLSEEVRRHDPILALDGGDDGLTCLNAVLESVCALLSPQGAAFVEIGWDQKAKAEKLVAGKGLLVQDIHHDFSGYARVLEISHGDK